MASRHLKRIWRTILVVLSGALCWGTSLWAAPLPTTRMDELRLEAQEFEAKGQWARAGEIYAFLLSKDHGAADLREHYHLCLRHIHQHRLLRDDSIQDDLLARSPAEVLNIYVEVLTQVGRYYVDDQRAHPGLLFHQGLVEFRFALEDPVFVQKYLYRFSPEKIREFAAGLEQWPQKPISTPQEAREAVRTVARQASAEFGLLPAVVILEFAWGACNGLDEYTVCLSPAQYRDVLAVAHGEAVGIGVELEMVDHHLLIAQVYPDGPAQGQLNKGDRLTTIDGRSVDQLSVEAATVRLRGKNGSSVEVTVTPVGETNPRTLKFERRPVVIRTVESQRPLDEDIGYIKLVGFQKHTPNELKEAIFDLRSRGMKVLVLDLRDNAGGSFFAAVETAQMFLSTGLIVVSRCHPSSKDSPLPSELKFLNKEFKADNRDAFTSAQLPMVVLVNADTASAAEVFAGALKENGRAILVGQTTYGKGTIQCTVEINPLAGGIRITVARLYSPSNQPYTGRGIVPDYVVELDGVSDDAQQREALELAKHLAGMLRTTSPQPSAPPQ